MYPEHKLESLWLTQAGSLVFPGQNPSPHVHQVVGGNLFNVTMDPTKNDLGSEATCTTCTFSEDFSNYWTATFFFKAKNGSVKRVVKMPQSDISSTKGGMMVYYMSDALFDNAQRSSVTAFKPGFRMTVGSPAQA